MINREDIKFIENILSFDNRDVSLYQLTQTCSHLEKQDYEKFYDFILDKFQNTNYFKNTLLRILTAYRQDDYQKLIDAILDLLDNQPVKRTYLKNGIIPILNSLKDENQPKLIENILSFASDGIGSKKDLADLVKILKYYKDSDILNFYITCLTLLYPNMDLSFLADVLKSIKDKPSYKKDVLDSFSTNQLNAKSSLVSELDNLGILNNDTNVVIWGSWYGSILMPLLSPKVNSVLGVDIDKEVIDIGKKKLLKKYKNINYKCANIFDEYLNTYQQTNLIINTSCEHMPPMKDWPWFSYGAMLGDKLEGKKRVYSSTKLSENCYFAFQSNNMYGIEGHTNCVDTIDDFKLQMPERASIIKEIEVEDTRGTRFMLIGKFDPLVD